MKNLVSCLQSFIFVLMLAAACLAILMPSCAEARGFGRGGNTTIVGGNGGFTQARFGLGGNLRSFQSFGGGGGVPVGSVQSFRSFNSFGNSGCGVGGFNSFNSFNRGFGSGRTLLIVP